MTQLGIAYDEIIKDDQSLAEPRGMPDRSMPDPILSDDEPNTAASFGLIALATVVLLAGFALVAFSDRKVDPVAATTSIAISTTAAVTTETPSTPATSAISTTPADPGAPSTTLPAGQIAIAAPEARLAAGVVQVHLVDTAGAVCASGPGAIVTATGVVLAPVLQPAGGCSNPNYQVDMTAGGTNTLAVQFQADLVATDAAAGYSLLRVTRDIDGRVLPTPSFSSLQLWPNPLTESKYQAASIAGTGDQRVVEFAPSAFVPQPSGSLALVPGLSASAGAVAIDSLGRLVGTLTTGPNAVFLPASAAVALARSVNIAL